MGSTLLTSRCSLFEEMDKKEISPDIHGEPVNNNYLN